MKKIICATGAAAALLLALTSCSAATPTSLVGTWGDPEEKGTPSLVFSGTDESGDYNGTDGCNVVGGSYTTDENLIDLGVMRATLMYCEGIDTWLTQVTSATLDGSTLTFSDKAGVEVGSLERTGD